MTPTSKLAWAGAAGPSDGRAGKESRRARQCLTAGAGEPPAGAEQRLDTSPAGPRAPSFGAGAASTLTQRLSGAALACRRRPPARRASPHASPRPPCDSRTSCELPAPAATGRRRTGGRSAPYLCDRRRVWTRLSGSADWRRVWTRLSGRADRPRSSVGAQIPN